MPTNYEGISLIKTFLTNKIRAAKYKIDTIEGTCDCPIRNKPNLSCTNRSSSRLISLFDEGYVLNCCGKHIRTYMKVFLFPGLTLLYNSGEFKPNPLNNLFYPSKRTFYLRFENLLHQNGLYIPTRPQIDQIVIDVFSTQEPIELPPPPPPPPHLPHLLPEQCDNYRPRYIRFFKIKDEKSNLLNDNCSICLGDLKDERSGRLDACSHVFHVSCIDKMAAHNIEHCPMCRTNIQSY